MKRISVRLPASYIETLERLVREGYFNNKSDAVRKAIERLINKEIYRLVTNPV
ncbi:MAG: ribbon-helix-helix domain-containing protein [Candidatus Baldrarchaeota archaeon]